MLRQRYANVIATLIVIAIVTIYAIVVVIAIESTIAMNSFIVTVTLTVKPIDRCQKPP